MALLHTQTVEKTFAGRSKAAKFVNVFSIEYFVLYSMHALKSAQTQQYGGQEGHSFTDNLRTLTCTFTEQLAVRVINIV